ncbi:MAG: ATP-binding cassette domain-containing protein [Streptococcaceae bacterium]|jgi:ABC-2 type transport system ATP-binding protein|nr:ATP-binding cassette domain-containing protein [Streptococcaceae bacterium]
MPLEIKNLVLPGITPFSIDIKENGLYGLIGKNGIGKSTLFSVLSGEIAFSQGLVRAGRVAYLPDVECFDGNLSANDYFKLLNTEEYEKALRQAKKFGVADYLKLKVSKYSLGMKQRLATVLSFSINCDVLIIDELFSGLDVAVKSAVYEELNKMASEKIVLLTSHNLKEIEHFCEKTFLLSETGIHEVKDFDDAAKEIGYIELFA